MTANELFTLIGCIYLLVNPLIIFTISGHIAARAPMRWRVPVYLSGAVQMMLGLTGVVVVTDRSTRMWPESTWELAADAMYILLIALTSSVLYYWFGHGRQEDLRDA